MSDNNNQGPTPPSNRQASPKTIKVRVVGKQPVFHSGGRASATDEKGQPVTHEMSEDDVKALGAHVQKA